MLYLNRNELLLWLVDIKFQEASIFVGEDCFRYSFFWVGMDVLDYEVLEEYNTWKSNRLFVDEYEIRLIYWNQ